jgi:hypothetical protein
MCLTDSQRSRLPFLQSERKQKHPGYKGWAASVVLLLALLPALAVAHTIAELSQALATFDQQPVSVVGKVTNLVTRYGDTLYTTFDLVDANDTAVPVVFSGKPTFAQGDLCHITGLFVQEKTIGTYLLTRGIEAEKVEKVSAAEYKTAGQLFRKKQGSGKKAANQYPRGLYVPQ